MAMKMTSIALLCLLLLERFLTADIDDFTEPVLRGLRVLETSALEHVQNAIPPDILSRSKNLTRFYLYTPELDDNGVQLRMGVKSSFLHFNPDRETKIIIHGFLDKVIIAEWMHEMKNQFLLFDNFNVIIVDWSLGNFIPYTQAAANTETAGNELSHLLLYMMENYGAKPRKFHILGHSLGSHVAGYVGERIKGIKRITALDPAAHMFRNASPRSKLDRTDAEFVDVIHTDAGGIGIVEPLGHVDFYPNGGEVQPGCTASNSLRSLLEKGVIEGVRNIICSHMRAPLLFTDSINARHCEMVGHECSSFETFMNGECVSCQESSSRCAIMGYHVDMRKNYGNGTKYYFLTAETSPYCGYEYKLTLSRVKPNDKTWRILPRVFRSTEWSSVDILHVSLYGSSGSTEFSLEGRDKHEFQSIHVVLSPVDLGNIHGAILRWTKKPVTRARGVANAISSVVRRDAGHPFIHKIQVKPMKSNLMRKNIPGSFELCASPVLTSHATQKGSTLRTEYC